MVKHHPPSYDRQQKKWRANHNLVAIYIPLAIKKTIGDVVKGLGNTSISKQCSEAVISVFDELDMRSSIIESARESQLILKGMEKFGELHFKKSVTEEFCDVNGCGGKMVRLSYPIQTDGKVEIRPVRIITCEICGSIKER